MQMLSHLSDQPFLLVVEDETLVKENELVIIKELTSKIKRCIDDEDGINYINHGLYIKVLYIGSHSLSGGIVLVSNTNINDTILENIYEKDSAIGITPHVFICLRLLVPMYKVQLYYVLSSSNSSSSLLSSQHMIEVRNAVKEYIDTSTYSDDNSLVPWSRVVIGQKYYVPLENTSGGLIEVESYFRSMKYSSLHPEPENDSTCCFMVSSNCT
jgi:hypothetical protein